MEKTYQLSLAQRHEFLTPEHLLYSLLDDSNFSEAMVVVDGDMLNLQKALEKYIKELDKVPDDINYSPYPSVQFLQMVTKADGIVYSSGNDRIIIAHLIKGILNLQNSTAQYALKKSINGDEGFFLSAFLGDVDIEPLPDEEEDFDPPFDFDDDIFAETLPKKKKKEDWKNLVVCINDIYKHHNPLIGREEEIRKTITVLCRKEKNNPLHIGEPGVGKTALIYGLAKMIEDNSVPEKLKGAKIYRIDLGSLIAGTQYRGDFEKRIKNIMDGIISEPNPIVYIDEIHNLVGAGAVGESSMDASNILKPYLESGEIRFIGATTYDEYKRHFAKSKSIVRRFSNIDVAEPSIDETINILKQLQKHYEEFHNVSYTDEAIEFAVKGSAKHINDRFLPDKAIDLLDESGALKQLNMKEGEPIVVDKEAISAVLAKICKVESLAITDDDPHDLENIEERISSQLFGQNKAIKEVSEAVLMSKAGLEEENKPIASLLFVGPTGVGKTELAKLLAKELGVELLRFDMSEYTEKHTVAKLIGAPAGYVGYDDGGLLTDAIRKTPNAVLLLDEIEKAHSDIYNILLQVMDYAKLTDNKGNKADFRNVVLIMTSNAGAQFAAQANVGFASSVTRGDAMLKQVKQTFKPEFLNRLSATVVFNDMSREMASMILDKKLKELGKKLESKNVRFSVSEEVKELLLEKGFTKEYGARELDRVIKNELKRLLMKEILFGELKEGGELLVKSEKGKIILCQKN
ncbi:MAG: AAA family ATPase [Muribaculaceae bacterium]|nr:AAA family ATPase [Muribaculaceae bacterium]